MTNRIWLDVEDIFEYAAFNARPTGIQRLQIELCRALVAADPTGERIGFIRHDPARQSFRSVAWRQVQALFDTLQHQPEPSRPPTRAAAEMETSNALKRRLYRLPAPIRQPLLQGLVEQRAAVRSFAQVLRASVRSSRSQRSPAPLAADNDATRVEFANAAQRGDVVLVLGAIWYHPDYAGLIRTACAAHGLRFAVLVYDIIPLRRPEWCEQRHSRSFRAWFTAMIGHADQVFSISRASATDIERYVAEHALDLRRPVTVLPLGTGFTPDGETPDTTRAPPSGLPKFGSYALIVSTIEARKNHALLFRVWRRLLDDLPREQVPTLVFAGRVGWMVADLMTALRNCDFLDGKIVHLPDTSDAELGQLYRGCLFTVFPSFYEGWGLPVSESLGFGRPCFISRATALPEAGGTLARYFDPDNATEAYAVIRDALARPEALAAWQEQVTRDFRPIPWSRTAEIVLRVLLP